MTPSHRARSSLAFVAALALVAASSAHAQGVESPRVPLRTAITEINTLRAEYADAYNRKATTVLATMFLPDAVMIRPDGSMLMGQTAIGKALAQDAPGWGQATLVSDTMRVFGNTAWDVGRLNSKSAKGDASVTHYLVVLRRGIQEWKISSLAVVPETPLTATK